MSLLQVCQWRDFGVENSVGLVRFDGALCGADVLFGLYEFDSFALVSQSLIPVVLV